MSDYHSTWKSLPSLPDAEGFAGSYAGSHNGALIVAGGANFPDKPFWEGGTKTWTDLVFVLTQDSDSWQVAGSLPIPYAYGSCVEIPHGVLCIGGCNAEGHHTDVYLLSWDDNKLSVSNYPELPKPLANTAAVFHDGKVYLTGGSIAPGEQDCTPQMWVLDLFHLREGWMAAPAIPGRGRFLHQMATWEDKIYVLGGIGLVPQGDKMIRDLLTEAWEFSPEAGWSQLADLPHPVAAAPTPAPATLAGHIYLLGGDDGSLAGFSPVWEHPGFHNQSLCYDAVSQTWHDSGEIAAPRAVLPCATWNGQAVIVNGERRPGKRSNEVWAATLS
jgi:N-acetylneuraminic acid mutarotase